MRDLRNHAAAIAAIDMCVVQTVTFDRLFAFLVLGHDRRQLLWFEVTQHPTAEWLARQNPVRDNDQACGQVSLCSGQSDGYPRQPISPRGALAKRNCRTFNWHASPRMPGSAHCLWRVSLAAIHRLLQSGTPAPGFAKGCAIKTSRAADRQRRRYSSSRRGCIINMRQASDTALGALRSYLG